MTKQTIVIQTRSEQVNGDMSKVKTHRIAWSDLHDTFKKNWQTNSSYEISFTLTYQEKYKDVFEDAEDKAFVYYDGQGYNVQQRTPGHDENGLLTQQITATHEVIDKLKNIRADTPQPTEQNPDVDNTSGSDDKDSSSNSSSDSNDNQNQQPSITVKQTDVQQTVTLDSCLQQFTSGNDQGISYELHGNFPQAAVKVEGSLYEWLDSNLKLFGAYWVPDGHTVKIYDSASFKHPTGKQFRYQNNTHNVSVQIDTTDLINDCDVYGGKMEKDIVNAGVGNGISEAVNGDWTPVIKNAGAMMKQNLSAQDINLVLAQINLESSGREDARGGTDGLGDGPALGLLQFKQGTFNYYCRPPYTNIMHGLDQIIALFNVPNWRSQITGRHGWSPHGAPVSKDELKPAVAGGAQKWLAVARSYVGIPYVWGGGHSPDADPRNGMDCSGLGEQIARACGLNIGYGNTVSLEQGSTDISRDQVQTGDMGFYGARGNSTHVVWAMDNDTYIAEPDVGQTCYIGKINDYPANFWKRNPQIAAFVGNGASSGGGDSTTETYYALHFHFTDGDSVKKYGLHRGPQLIVDSIYDMDALKKYADANIQHDPKTTVTISNTKEHANLGDVWRFIDPEMNINTDVTVFGVNEGDDYFENSDSNEISLDNTALAMRNINATLLGQFKSLNNRPVVNESINLTATSQRQENHFGNINATDMTKIREFTEGTAS